MQKSVAVRRRSRLCAIKVQDTQGFPMERKYSVPSASCSGTMGSTESVIVNDSKV
jgi:hypothetical protein